MVVHEYGVGSIRLGMNSQASRLKSAKADCEGF